MPGEALPVPPKPADFGQLQGWPNAQHELARHTFRISSRRCGQPDRRLAGEPAQVWFERSFLPVLAAESGQLTGYYEPELAASPVRTARFCCPLYRQPPEPLRVSARAEIEAGALGGLGLELAWVEHAIDAFLIQVQGSARLVFPDGQIFRIGYACGNGRRYTSIGREMARLRLAAESEVTVRKIRDFCIGNPDAGRALMQSNASFVFFRHMDGLANEDGSAGSLGLPLTANISAAVDPAHIPLGLPVWVETEGPAFRFFGLVVAQDTGGAIKGPGRIDLFLGSGDAAGDLAGRINQSCRVFVFRSRSRS